MRRDGWAWAVGFAADAGEDARVTGVPVFRGDDFGCHASGPVVQVRTCARTTLGAHFATGPEACFARQAAKSPLFWFAPEKRARPAVWGKLKRELRAGTGGGWPRYCRLKAEPRTAETPAVRLRGSVGG